MTHLTPNRTTERLNFSVLVLDVVTCFTFVDRDESSVTLSNRQPYPQPPPLFVFLHVFFTDFLFILLTITYDTSD